MKNLETRVPPPILMVLGALAMGAVSFALPVAAPGWRWVAAAAIFAVAGVFGFPAIRAFARAGTTINPVRIEGASALVTGGVFGITRNPMYVSLTLLLLAVAAALGNPWALAGPMFFALWINRLQIVPEERVLRAKFGADYAGYCGRVRRWI